MAVRASAEPHDPAFRGEVDIPGRGRAPDPEDPRGQWPRMLNLDEDTEDRLLRFLDHEIEQARIEKDSLVEDWKNWQADYFATPNSEQKNFPFERAANIVIPMTAIAVEAVHARLMNTIFAVEPFWSIRPTAPEWVDAAPAVEDWLQTEVENPSALDVYDFAQDSLMELTKLGTAVGKSGYERDIRKTVDTSPTGSRTTRWHERHNGATLDYVPVANFLMRMAEDDPQQARWVGEEHSFNWAQIKRMALSGRFDPDAVDEIKTWIGGELSESPAQEYQEEMDEHARQEPQWNDQFNITEIWASFDVDKDGVDEEIVIDYHWSSGTILSIRYNWYEDLHRPYRITQYVRVEGRWAGIGIGKQNEQFQQEITTVHRQRLDNATLANMRMFAVKKGAGYDPDETIFPGKLWFLDDPQADINPIQMSEVYQSSIINEDELVRFSEKRTGVNRVLLGMPKQGTPGTATGTLQRIAEGNKRFDLVLKNVRRWFGKLGRDVLANYQQFGDQRRHFVIQGQGDAEWVERVLQMPSTLVANGAVVDLTATDSTTNKQVQQQQWMSLFQILNNYYRNIIELASIIEDDTLLVQAARRAVGAGDEATKRLLETFDVVDPERLLMLNRNRREGQRGPRDQPPQAGPPRVAQPATNGGGPTAGGPDQAARLESLGRFIEGLGGPEAREVSLRQLAGRG